MMLSLQISGTWRKEVLEVNAVFNVATNRLFIDATVVLRDYFQTQQLLIFRV